MKRGTAYPFTHRWDDAVEIVGFDSGPGVVINGDLWAVDVVWRGMNDHLRDLQVIWEVRDQADRKDVQHAPAAERVSHLGSGAKAK